MNALAATAEGLPFSNLPIVEVVRLFEHADDRFQEAYSRLNEAPLAEQDGPLNGAVEHAAEIRTRHLRALLAFRPATSADAAYRAMALLLRTVNEPLSQDEVSLLLQSSI